MPEEATHTDNRGIGLLTTDRLIALVEESERCGVSLCALKEVLSRQGLIDVNLSECRGVRGDGNGRVEL